jgi:hypothetical protein
MLYNVKGKNIIGSHQRNRGYKMKASSFITVGNSAKAEN